MPSSSEKQRRLFSIAEHAPSELYDRNKSLLKLSHQTLHDFASSVIKKKQAKKKKRLKDYL